MTIAKQILATAHTLGQVRRASFERCCSHTRSGDVEDYRFGDRSAITIRGKKIIAGEWVFRQDEVIQPHKRKCHTPDCWACSGTGIDGAGEVCNVNDAIPF